MKRVLLRILSGISVLILLVYIILTSSCAPKVLKVTFITSPQVLDAGVISGIMTMQLQDTMGKPSIVKNNTVINLTSTSTSGRFDTNASGLFNGNTTSVTISGGSSSASFYYRDTAAGTPTITPVEQPNQGWHHDQQQQRLIRHSASLLVLCLMAMPEQIILKKT